MSITNQEPPGIASQPRPEEQMHLPMNQVATGGHRTTSNIVHYNHCVFSGGSSCVQASMVDMNRQVLKREERYVDVSISGSGGHYIECAFNFSNSDEAYLFTADQCLQINYAPGTSNDYIIKGPMSFSECFPYLKDTIFAGGIDAAFTPASRENEAYIFRSNMYACINFATNGGGYIVQGPKKIRDGFSCALKNTVFEDGIDAAFASSRKNQAYIFKGDRYARITFVRGTTTDECRIEGPRRIASFFPCLKDTIFRDGFDAAFSSSITNEAYLFKGNTYVRINYAPGTADDYIVYGPVTPISDGFHCLKGIIPM